MDIEQYATITDIIFDWKTTSTRQCIHTLHRNSTPSTLWQAILPCHIDLVSEWDQ